MRPPGVKYPFQPTLSPPSLSFRLFTHLMFLWSLSGLFPPILAADKPPIDFARQILPILSDNCFQCHGPDVNEGRKGDLRLDDESDVKRDRNGHHVVLPGKPDESELWLRINSTDDDLRMPPPELGRTLQPGQVDLITQWIQQGAKWGRHWALERIERPAMTPAEADRHPVDALVDRVLKQENVRPGERASRSTLLRRVALDLTGLPASESLAADFMGESNHDVAWPRLIDQLLASPQFGERMAWDWLEAARYADSNGYQGDNDRTMWPWRDWVVKAFNEDLPYDKFTIWQLAGDLLPNATEEQILATGFNRNYMINGEGGRIAEENRVDYVMDMTETMGTVWLGLTLNCCRCHDHKFDPLQQREYFQLTAFFNQTPVDGAGGNAQTPPVLAVPSSQQQAELRAIKTELAELDEQILSHRKQLQSLQPQWEEQVMLSDGAETWQVLIPSSTTALHQKLQTDSTGLTLASGVNPVNDEYTLRYVMRTSTTINSLRLDAVRHSSMTNYGLARSDSGNFVLTDLQFQIQQNGLDESTTAKQSISDTTQHRAAVTTTPVAIASAMATFEQGNLKVQNTFDADPISGWAVWNGKSLDQDHAAIFRLAKPLPVQRGDELSVTMKFNSPHAFHNLGHFKWSYSASSVATFDQQSDQLIAAIRQSAAHRTDAQQALITETFQAQDKLLNELRAKRSVFTDKMKQIQSVVPKVMVMQDTAAIRPTFILDRGLYNQPRDEVFAAVPSVLPPLKQPKNADRLDLANWLVSRDHPLMARVTVNRFWQMLFGVGLVKTAEDFGVQGEYPIHRELLDWLSAEFIESGWNVKHLLKLIVTSETYQRSSVLMSTADYERDPQNRLLARGARFRLPSWMIRDQALAVAGLLHPQIGGPPVYAYQPEGVWSEATFGKRKYSPDKGSALYRRSLYTFWRRIIGPPIFFDTARRQVCEVKPLRTNTPMHALTTQNDVTFVEAARVLAQLVLSQQSSTDERFQFAAMRIFGRAPTLAELAIWQRSLARAEAAFQAAPENAVAFISFGASEHDSTLPVESLAAWTAVCLNLLNTDEALTRE